MDNEMLNYIIIYSCFVLFAVAMVILHCYLRRREDDLSSQRLQIKECHEEVTLTGMQRRNIEEGILFQMVASRNTPETAPRSFHVEHSV